MYGVVRPDLAVVEPLTLAILLVLGRLGVKFLGIDLGTIGLLVQRNLVTGLAGDVALDGRRLLLELRVFGPAFVGALLQRGNQRVGHTTVVVVGLGWDLVELQRVLVLALAKPAVVPERGDMHVWRHAP